MELPINQIICGDCIEVMKTWPDNCIDSIITDPPYGLEFMGKEWDRLSGGFSDGKFKGFRLPMTSGGNRNVKCPDCGKWIYDHPPRNCQCGGLVLDPFTGSVTTCIAAKRTGRIFIGIEKDADYCRIAEKRLAEVDCIVPVRERKQGQKVLFI
jgi:DNA modification methylase